jgi:aquaporin Z
MSDSIVIADNPTLGQKIAAEVIGTFGLVLFGVGAAVLSGDYAATGLAFGIAVLVFVYAFGRISGGHFNPAVSVGAAISGRVPWSTAGIYCVAQIFGGLLAGATLFAVLHGIDGYTSEGNIGANGFGDHSAVGLALWAALIIEIVTTLVFVWVILGVTDERNESVIAFAGVAIGLTLTGIHYVSLNLTGTSVNPARSFGVAVFGGTDAIAQVWLFFVGPLLGALIAGVTYPLIFGRGAEPVPGSGFSFAPRQPALPYGAPTPYEQQWNQQEWNQQGGQQWQQPPAQQQPPQAQQWAQPPAPQQQYWNQPPPPQAPQQQPPQPPQPPAQEQPWQQPGGPQQWGQPGGDDDGHTQVRRDD